MNATSTDAVLFAEKISATEEKLEALELEIAEIGQPAAKTLRKRLEALKIEEHALKRNFEEAQAGDNPDPHRMEQVTTLLHHIEREEASLEHEADFLHQSSPSSVSLAAEAGASFFSALGRGMRRILKGHHPLGKSVFVNRSSETLVTRYGLRRKGSKPNSREEES